MLCDSRSSDSDVCQSWWCWCQKTCRFHGRLFVVVDCCKRAFECPPRASSFPLFAVRLQRSIVRYRWSCHRLSRPDDYYPRHIVYQVRRSDQFHGNRRLSAVTSRPRFITPIFYFNLRDAFILSNAAYGRILSKCLIKDDWWRKAIWRFSLFLVFYNLLMNFFTRGKAMVNL